MSLLARLNRCYVATPINYYLTLTVDTKPHQMKGLFFMWKLCNRPYSSGIPKPKSGKIKSSDSEHKLKNNKKKTSKLNGVTVESPIKKTSNSAKQNTTDADKNNLNSEKLNLSFIQEMSSFVDACCCSELESVAHTHMKVVRHKKDASIKTLQTIHIYNRLMHAWAKKCMLEKIQELFTLLHSDGLKPTLQSYAACLECLGRKAHLDITLVQKILVDMERDGLDVKELFNSCVFCNDEQHFILKALWIIDPEYRPKPPMMPPPPLGPLLKDLDSSWPKEKIVEKNPYALVLPNPVLFEQAEIQLQQEISGVVTVKSIVKKSEPSPRTLEYRKILESQKKEWRTMLTSGFERELRSFARKNRSSFDLNLYPFLKVLDVQDYVTCQMQEIEELASSSDAFSPCKTFLWKRLGERLHRKFLMVEKVKNQYPQKVNKLYKQYVEVYNDPDLELDSHRQQFQKIMAQSLEGPTLDTAEREWPAFVVVGLGKLLFEIILCDLKVDANLNFGTKSSGGKSSEKKLVPAFYSIYRSNGLKSMDELKPHPLLIKLYKGAELDELQFDSSFLPMLVPPLPWVSSNLGGYLLSSVHLIRMHTDILEQPDNMNGMADAVQLAGVFDSLNILSACAWIINKKILDIVIEIFNNKGDPLLDIPPPATVCPLPPKITQTMTATEKAEVYKMRQKFTQERAEMYSLWCQELYKLSIANRFRDKVFWFPHNLDFRGRTYPCPPHFNHLGGDVTRGILMFAKGKPLGSKGLDWLKTHLINLTGFKKRCSLEERLAYANEMLHEILDSADNPLSGRKWWQTSDEPWQTLACCIEVANAVRSPNPEQYVCHLPIHQDGSCNGLQHYAALGRDKAGALSVNLWPASKPQDVYSDVCELVEKERKRDADNGLEIAKVLEGCVRRKVIKQTIMTTVYGVTQYGAKLQILRQLKDIPTFPQKHAWAGSRYLTEKTFQCLNQMFSSAKDIQDWLTLSARQIATLCQRPVEWTTPIGLPVIQPYHKSTARKQFDIYLQDTRNYYAKPNATKQKNAFPPNFIHSLDSTHMMLTALYCMRAGITFVSVHDCFWTHACDVEIMNKICRQQFIALHKQPILEDLSRQLLEKFAPETPNCETMDAAALKRKAFLCNVLQNVPSRGDFDLDKVLESTYFFS